LAQIASECGLKRKRSSGFWPSDQQSMKSAERRPGIGWAFAGCPISFSTVVFRFRRAASEIFVSALPAG
jgi:hypothetical protein